MLPISHEWHNNRVCIVKMFVNYVEEREIDIRKMFPSTTDGAPAVVRKQKGICKDQRS